MKYLFIVYIVVALYFFISCDSFSAKESQTIDYFDGYATQANQNLRYFRDDRTDTCFALTWVGAGSGGPGLATVDCTKVGKYLR